MLAKRDCRTAIPEDTHLTGHSPAQAHLAGLALSRELHYITSTSPSPRPNYSNTLHVQHFCGDQWDSFVLRFIMQRSLTVPLHVPSLSSPCSLLPIMNLSLLPRLLLNLINLISKTHFVQC